MVNRGPNIVLREFETVLLFSKTVKTAVHNLKKMKNLCYTIKTSLHYIIFD